MHDTRPADGDGVPRAPVVAPAPIRREPLSRERIVDAAVDFIDSHCLSDLSMRRLGAELGVEAMSLYRYFPSKAALLDHLVCGLIGGLVLPTGEADWEASVRGYARSFRDIAHRHPRLYPLLATAAPQNRTMSDVMGRMLEMWRRAGLDAEQAARAQCAVQGFVTGATLWEVAQDGEDHGPASIRASGAGGGRGHRDEFEFGLDVLIAGLSATLPAVPAVSSAPDAA